MATSYVETEGKIKAETEVTRRQGRRGKKLLDDLKDRRGYSHLKEEALDRSMWRDRFGRGFEPVLRQEYWMMMMTMMMILIYSVRTVQLTYCLNIIQEVS